MEIWKVTKISQYKICPTNLTGSLFLNSETDFTHDQVLQHDPNFILQQPILNVADIISLASNFNKANLKKLKLPEESFCMRENRLTTSS